MNDKVLKLISELNEDADVGTCSAESIAPNVGQAFGNPITRPGVVMRKRNPKVKHVFKRFKLPTVKMETK